MVRHPMFLVLCIPGAVALALAVSNALRRQWVPAGLHLAIGLGVIVLSVWQVWGLSRLDVPIESSSGAIVMTLPGRTAGDTLMWAVGFLGSAIGLVQYPDILWRWWLSYPAALVALCLSAAASYVAMNEQLARIVADSEGIQVGSKGPGGFAFREKVVWREVRAVSVVATTTRRTSRSTGTTTSTKRELILTSKEGEELLKLGEPLVPEEAYQRFLGAIPAWAGLEVERVSVVR
jgi:hypothetical protein